MPNYTPDTTETSSRLPVLIKKLGHCLTMTQESICGKYDLTGAEAALLSSMEPLRKLCSTALMERQDLSKGRISRIVESLSRKGFLVKVEHHDDRRHNIITLTDRGREVRQAIVQEQSDQCHRVLAQVPEEQRAMILPALEQLAAALERVKPHVERIENEHLIHERRN